MKTIKNTIFINNDPGKLPLYMSIEMGKYDKYIKYHLALWIAVELHTKNA